MNDGNEGEFWILASEQVIQVADETGFDRVGNKKFSAYLPVTGITRHREYLCVGKGEP